MVRNRRLECRLHGRNLYVAFPVSVKVVNISCTSGPAKWSNIARRLCFVAAVVVSFIISPFLSVYNSNEFYHLVHRGPIVAGSEKQSNFGNMFFSIARLF